MSNSIEANYFLKNLRSMICRPKPLSPAEMYAFFHRESAKRQQEQLKKHAEVLELIRVHQSRLGVNHTDPEKIIAREAGIKALADLDIEIRKLVVGEDAEQLLILYKVLNLPNNPSNVL